MIFTIEEINRNDRLLPNLTLGYRIYDSCSTPFHALRAAMTLLGGQEEGSVESDCSPEVPAVIGDGGSTLSLVVARLLGIFHVPQVSYFSSCACLSNKDEFPAFLRTMPSDFFQVDALALLVRHFGWTWVGSVAGDDAYGRQGVQIFNEEVRKLGACVAFHEVIPKNHEAGRMSGIVERIRVSGARVVLLFALEQDAGALFREVLRQNLTGIQWLASEAWITAAVLSTPSFHPILLGSVGFAIRRTDIPDLQSFLLRLHPSMARDDPFLLEFWEKTFGCSLDGGGAAVPRCTGSEQLASTQNIYSDVTQLRISYNVYKAVYAIAHALNDMFNCEPGKGPFPGWSCPDTTSIQPWQLLHYLKQAEFTNEFGEEMKFDKNGDPVAMYDLMNWQVTAEGRVEFVTVGRFDGTLSLSRKLEIKEKAIIWNGPQKQPLCDLSCSRSCQPGTRKAIKPRFPVCCFDCVICAAGEISNQTDAIECLKCLPEFWSNPGRTECVPKQVEYLSYRDTMGITLLAVALLGACCTVGVAFIFVCHRTTPIVRANNSELSFLILCSLALCFLCALTFIGQPTDWSCMLRHSVFGIAFVLCISCILGKTIVVLMAFRATLPGSKVMKWFGPTSQRAIIFLCTLVQVLICSLWLVLAPPTPQRLLPRESARIILLCNVGSALAFCLVLGYIGVLSCVCFLLAFLARKLPGNFNEAKLITFSMLIFFAVWIAFVPAYISSPGKYATATEIFAIIASSFGLLACLFFPKCYIILLKPEKNTRKHIMPLRGHSGEKSELLHWRGTKSHRVDPKAQLSRLAQMDFPSASVLLSLSLCAAFLGTAGLQEDCERWDDLDTAVVHKDGHVILAGMFPIHSKGVEQEHSYSAEGNSYFPMHYCHNEERSLYTGLSQCTRSEVWTGAMIFFIEQINRDPTLLPNVTLGYRLYDTCGLEQLSPLKSWGGRCVSPSLPLIIGDSGSTLSMAISRLLNLNRVPLVSYFASCACLSDKRQFPYFFRTIPSDVNQADALARLVRHFGWTWVGTMGADDDYGRMGIDMFTAEVTKLGVCVAFRVIIPKLPSSERMREIVTTIRDSTATVIVAFAIEEDIQPVIQEIVRQNVTGKQWVASEAWVTSTLISTRENLPFLDGTIGFAIRRAEMPELKKFLESLDPLAEPHNSFAREFWEMQFQCSLNTTEPLASTTEPTNYKNNSCTGAEKIHDTDSIYNDVSQLRVTYNMHKAVYAVAHALHNMLICKHGGSTHSNSSCADIHRLQSWQIVQYLKEVSYTNLFGDVVQFDDNGDPVGSYDIINWQKDSAGSVKYVTVGRFDSSLPPQQQLVFSQRDIVWHGGHREVSQAGGAGNEGQEVPMSSGWDKRGTHCFSVSELLSSALCCHVFSALVSFSPAPPVSVCSDSCPTGYRKATRPGQPVCCYDCVPCAEGTISNSTDQPECIQCPEDFWSNEKQDSCIIKEIEFLSYTEAFGMVLAAMAILGALFTAAVAAIFLRHRGTPIVRANNMELSFLLLLSLVCCFLCALTFLGRPSHWGCRLRRTSFGISFALCLSCLLSKTLVVLMAFQATLPGNSVARWFGPTQQRLGVLVCAAVQGMVCGVWLTRAPPYPVKNTWLYRDRIILECHLGSVALFCCVLGYIGCLAGFCFVLAFLARKLPDNFNEAKFITFSMLIFCAVADRLGSVRGERETLGATGAHDAGSIRKGDVGGKHSCFLENFIIQECESWGFRVPPSCPIYGHFPMWRRYFRQENLFPLCPFSVKHCGGRDFTFMSPHPSHRCPLQHYALPQNSHNAPLTEHAQPRSRYCLPHNDMHRDQQHEAVHYLPRTMVYIQVMWSDVKHSSFPNPESMIPHIWAPYSVTMKGRLP
ncbi:hypothetical protein JZ751_001876 [Albula glossodonta]|uniref:G-protein coupled receptors family 3 profile domain-containing protein n=1 Tax=Albula glossodonta TaxID=121402 RepID=A0A8T2PA99_9TELE|nr:hypothetical protein JZ751_001876 [Albula glossodonta]